MKTIAIVGLVLLACASDGCGYALAGRGNALPAYIATIGLPLFVNQSTTPAVDRVLTDAVSAELQNKGKYRVQPDVAGVDATLTGTITSVTLRPVTFTENRQVSSYEIVVTARLEFKDLRDNKVLWESQAFRSSPEEFQVTTGQSANDPAALFTQAPNALERLSKRFAREVVTSIFEAF